MFSFLKSAVELVADAVDIVTAPAQIAVDLAGAAAAPVAEAARDLVQDIKSLKD